ncbi:taste receptor type 2 member 39-like [Pseudophryne corroboree]|uniref:taste receptor type 2 member 39-like n=1 Tax=Pseudophryne corroboree TaxID=495146 RepID=UPI003081A471
MLHSCSVTAIGVLLNAFIMTKILIWWLTGQTLQTIDTIMASLGAVRIILLIMCLKEAARATIAHSFVTIEDSIYYITSSMSVAFCSLWWGTVLCVFYCVKITSYSNRLFMRLKMNISRMVPWLLLTSLLVSILSSLPNIWYMYPGSHMNSTQDSNSSSFGDVTVDVNSENVFIIFFMGTLVPFLIFCTAIYLLIASLLKHTQNISSKDSGFTNTQLDSHIRAIRNMVSFLFLYALYFISSNLMILYYQSGNPAYILVCTICTSAYPSLHSVVLITSNAKLKRSFLAALCCARTINYQAKCLIFGFPSHILFSAKSAFFELFVQGQFPPHLLSRCLIFGSPSHILFSAKSAFFELFVQGQFPPHLLSRNVVCSCSKLTPIHFDFDYG